MRTVIIVPRRSDDGHRDRVWEWCKRRWERMFPDWPIYEGHHNDGPFNRSAAVNRAADLAERDGHWDVALAIDSDVLLGRAQVEQAVANAHESGLVTWGHRRWRGIRQDATVRILDDREDMPDELDRDELDLIVERTNPLSWSCCIAIPRPVWDDLGGFDERFRGWGFEDMAFQSVICGLYGYARIEGDVVHLWHERSEERIVPGKPRLTATVEYITNARLGRRYMVALRRDHALHDRGDQPASEEERLRDIENLQRDDAKYEPAVRMHGMPDWDTWWPTLEELRDGARAHRLGRLDVAVAVIVRTGGAPETWPVRRDYLVRSLESMRERVKGPVTQRVIYSDWGDADGGELERIAGDFGFYVAGEGHHGYTRGVQRLWGYVARRVKPEYLFVTEDDFVFTRDVDLTDLAEALVDDPNLAQVALLRQACYPREIEQGGILGWPRESFALVEQRGLPRLEHRLFWTMNPSMYRRSVTSETWPTAQSSERVFGDKLLRNRRSTRFAFWGSGEPWVEHIGEVRSQPTGATY